MNSMGSANAVDLGLFLTCLGSVFGFLIMVLTIVVLWRKVRSPDREQPVEPGLQFITRGEHDEDMREVRGKIDAVNDKLSTIAQDVREIVAVQRVTCKHAGDDRE